MSGALRTEILGSSQQHDPISRSLWASGRPFWGGVVRRYRSPNPMPGCGIAASTAFPSSGRTDGRPKLCGYCETGPRPGSARESGDIPRCQCVKAVGREPDPIHRCYAVVHASLPNPSSPSVSVSMFRFSSCCTCSHFALTRPPAARCPLTRQRSTARANQAGQISMHDKARNPPNRAGTISPIGFGAAFAAGCASDWHTSASPPASQSTHSLPNLESDDAVAPSAGHRFPLPSQVPPALANSHLFPPGSRRPAHCVFRCAPVCGLWSAVCGKPRLTAIFGVLFFFPGSAAPIHNYEWPRPGPKWRGAVGIAFRRYLQVIYIRSTLRTPPLSASSCLATWQRLGRLQTLAMLKRLLFDESDRVSLEGCSRRCGKTGGALQIRVCLSPLLVSIGAGVGWGY